MSTSRSRALDVFLRGDRNYVQATQLIARAADCLPIGDWSLKQAQFSRITSKRPTLCDGRANGSSIGSVQFENNGDLKYLHFKDLEAEAPQRTIPMDVSVHPVTPGSTDEICVYDATFTNTLEAKLNVLVQSIKAEHRRRYETAYDIWFTGIRSTAIACDGFQSSISARLQIDLIRNLQRGDQHQTMWNIQMTLQGGEIIQGMVTFAYKLS